MYPVHSKSRAPANASEPMFQMDQVQLYQMRYKFNTERATGLMWFLYEAIGFDLAKSWTVVLDPTFRFRIGPEVTSPVLRTRLRSTQSVLGIRHIKTVSTGKTTTKHWGLGCVPSIVEVSSSLVLQDSDLVRQPASLTTTKDTTRRLRPPKVDFGDFEHFAYVIESPSRQTWHTSRTTTSGGGSCPSQKDFVVSTNETHSHVSGSAAYMPKASIDAIQATETTLLTSLMSKKVSVMLPKVVPMSRRYSLYRNFIELKDLPGSVSSLRETIKNFSSLFSLLSGRAVKKIVSPHTHVSDLAGEYVSYHFGWKQTVQDVLSLLETPARIAKDINKMILRNGLPTTWRTTEKYSGDDTTVAPNFSYDATHGETNISLASRLQRDYEFKLVVNATFDFPPVALPDFRSTLWLRKLGVSPTPTDVYNLVPWSWLLDWFTGLGNYISAIDVINTDPSLFNWGFLTGITNGKIVTTHKSTFTDTTSDQTVGFPAFSQTILRNVVHESALNFRLQIRKDISRAYNVKATGNLPSLDSFQTSILSAILANRAGSSHHW